MFLVDSHCDSIGRTAKGECGFVNPYNFSRRFPQLQFAALFCSLPGDTPEKSRERTVRYLGHFFIALSKEKERLAQVRTYAEIETALNEGRHAALLTVEGGAGIASEDDLPFFRDLFAVGVRVFGMTWLTNALGTSNRWEEDGGADEGLTALGREVVAEGNRLGMVFDVSHLSDRSFYEMAALSQKPVVATHSNFRALCGHSRNLTDDMARELIRQGGMIGLNLCPAFVHREPERQTVETLFCHLEHGLSLGGEDAMGFGGDIDGIDGYPRPLTEADSIHDQLVEAMLRRNYPERLVNKVCYENYLCFLKKHLPN